MSLLLDIERSELIDVLQRRQLQLWMRETLREMHKSPYLDAGQWELMVETYKLCFPGAMECNYVGRCNSSRCPKHGPKGRA